MKLSREKTMNAGEPQVNVPHICVCICTYKRPLPLQRLLKELLQQKTDGLFTYSVIVADNDADETGKNTVEEFRTSSSFPVQYLVQTERGIAPTRNLVLQHASGDYYALIDDDELPIAEWLLQLFLACNRLQCDGVLGPVLRKFDGVPPAWLNKSRFGQRTVRATGLNIDISEARTGNVLLKQSVLEGDIQPFNPAIRAGSDSDFFARKFKDGFKFLWCAEAAVYEVIPPERWTRKYQIQRALLQGAEERKKSFFNFRLILKSLIAIPLYALLLPFLLLVGQHVFMDYLTRLCEHLARLLSVFGINPIRGAYLSD